MRLAYFYTRGAYRKVRLAYFYRRRICLNVPRISICLNGNARGWDREWRWTVGCLLDKVGTAKSPPSLLSRLGWHGEIRLFTIDVIVQLTVSLVLGLTC